MFNILRTLRRGQKASKRPQQQRKFVPRLEFLENRLAPSVSVLTNQSDYLPGATALINASGFDPGTAVQFQVVKTSVTPAVVESTWSVTDGSAADSDGALNGSVGTSWYVDPSFSLDASFTLTAIGLSGSVSKSASAIFTDSNPNLNSFQDGNSIGVINGNPFGGPYTNPGSWINGDLNSQKAQYFEGMAVPFETVFSTTPNTTYTLTIGYNTTKATTHAFDYLTSYDFNNTSPLNPSGLNWTTFADPLIGTGLPDNPSNPSISLSIPSDPNINPSPSITDQNMLAGHSQTLGQFIRLYGTTSSASDNFIVNVNTASHGYTLSSPYATGDTDTTITIQFKPAGSTVVIAWGEHIASEADWGTSPGGAFNISGSPYHVTVSATGAGTSSGAQAHQMQASVIAAPATITIKKTSEGGNGTFNFTGDLGSFSITTTGSSGPGSDGTGSQTFSVPPGTYNVTEVNLPPGWELENAATQSVTVTSGSTVTLPFLDEKLATIIVNKTANGGNAIFNFTGTTNGVDPGGFGTAAGSLPSNFSITTTGSPGTGSQTFANLDTDDFAYGIVETVPAGWVLVNASITGDIGPLGTPDSFHVLSGGTATVSFTDAQPSATISITPQTATNVIGHSETYTITVTAFPNGASPLFFGTPVVTSNAGSVGPVSPPIIIGNVATYTVTINSNTPGTFTTSVSDTVTMGGVKVAVGTNGQGGNSGPATKVYEEARILISPLTATNDVNQPHTLTAEVDISSDGTTWTPEANAPVTFSFIPPPVGSNPFFVGGVNSGSTNSNGQVSVQINSAVSGTFTIQATTTFAIAGVGGTFAATTGTGVPNSPNATKTYISLVPGINGDFSKVTDPEFLDLAVTNTSTVPLFLQSMNDQLPQGTNQVLLGNLFSPPLHNFITSISAEINGVLVPPASFKPGLAVPAGQTLDVLVIRTVQATDPTPNSLFLSSFGFNTLANGTGTAISATASAAVTIFHPSVTIGLGVSPTTGVKVGTTLTYTVTIHNTSTTNSPNLVFNVAPAASLTKGSNVVTGLSNTNLQHAFVGEFVWGAGIPVNTKITAVNGGTSVTLNKAATATTISQVYFGFGPAIVGGIQQPFVPPPLGFQIPAATLAEMENFAPGATVTFSYTHVVTATDPNPLTNRIDIFFYVQNTQAHPIAFANRIHGPSNPVSTGSTLSKTMFF